jgi:lipid A 4'-phosphatase
MTRNGLFVVLAAAVIVGAIFAVHPDYDLALSQPFFAGAVRFPLRFTPWLVELRDLALWLVALLMVPSLVALAVKLIRPRLPLLVRGRTIIFLSVTLALVPGLIANGLLKDHWGRPRPIDVTAFGGMEEFRAWWDPRGSCPGNCSFVSGDASGAFWTLAPAALAPPQWRAVAFGAALIFGAGVGLLRMMFGGHFFTDVFFAGIMAYVTIWIMHRLIFRWRTRLSDEKIDAALEWAILALRSLLPRWSGTP